MLKLDFWSKKKNPEGVPGSPPKPARPAFSMTKIRPKNSHFLGTTVSFCVDEHAIQMAAVRHVGKSRQVLDIKKEYFPRGQNDDKARKEKLLREIGDFASKYGGRRAKITLAVSSNETTFRSFLMPRMKKRELDSAVQFEVKKQIPFPAADCVYDYRPVFSIERDDNVRYKIGLQAATRRYIQEQLEPFEMLGLPVVQIYHTQDVIGQFLKHIPKFHEDKSYTLLNIGLKSTEISFYKGANLEFSHATAVSSNMLGAQPEMTKYEFFAELISNEIQTSLDYYAGQYSVSLHDKIYVYGDLAYSSELLELLNAKSGIELEPLPVANLTDLSTRDELQSEIFPVCLPVLAASTCQIALANLLPPELRTAQQKGRVGTYGRIGVGVLLILLATSWGVGRNEISSQENHLIELNRQIAEFQNSEAFHTYNLIKRRIAMDQSYLNQIKESPSYLALNLKELSQLTPGPVKLLYLDYKPDEKDQNLYLHGLVISDDIPPELILAEFVENLSASPFYENVKVVRHVKKKIEGHFEIDFQLNMKGVA
ncbi:MAG: pilus assembly protein PilM [Candidatus Zixiibacteriota bacterium]